MTYIFLAAGKGARLHPLTLNYPKSLYKLETNVTVLKRMTSLIKKYDKQAKIVIVTGFMADEIKKEINGVTFLHNPFYAVTNSIASLWFAQQYLDCEQVVIINGDIVMEEKLIKEVLCSKAENPYILMDSSIKTEGDYNVQVDKNLVLVMSKDLSEYHGEYAGITKLPHDTAVLLQKKIKYMVENQMYDQWYENALVQMIFEDDFKLSYIDICEYKWTEVDCVSDLLKAKRIHWNDKAEE